MRQSDHKLSKTFYFILFFQKKVISSQNNCVQVSWNGFNFKLYSYVGYYIRFPQDFETLGWCPVGPVLPHGEKVPL